MACVSACVFDNRKHWKQLHMLKAYWIFKDIVALSESYATQIRFWKVIVV